jgi:hypothetical protein
MEGLVEEGHGRRMCVSVVDVPEQRPQAPHMISRVCVTEEVFACGLRVWNVWRRRSCMSVGEFWMWILKVVS